MIAQLHRASSTGGMLAYLYGPGEHGTHDNPRLVAGDCHGAPIEMFTQPESLPYLAHSLDAPLERLGTRAPGNPTWICSVRSDPRRPDLTDAEWAEVAARMVVATGIAPVGDPGACRWIALRNEPRRVYVVATVAREDGRLHHGYRDAFRLQTECQRIAAELGPLPVADRSAQQFTETFVPTTITIAPEPSGSVVARGGNDLAKSLLNHAGFASLNDWHGARHRLPTTMDRDEQVAIASYATEMLRAARYTVDLDPALESTRSTDRSHSPGLQPIGDQVLELTDRIKAAETGADLADAVGPLLDPEQGVLERLREALEAVGEQITGFDADEYQLADRFFFASELTGTGQAELVGAQKALRNVVSEGDQIGKAQASSFSAHDSRSAALSTSPAATGMSASRNTSTAVPAMPAPSNSSRGSAPRSR